MPIGQSSSDRLKTVVLGLSLALTAALVGYLTISGQKKTTKSVKDKRQVEKVQEKKTEINDPKETHPKSLTPVNPHPESVRKESYSSEPVQLPKCVPAKGENTKESLKVETKEESHKTETKEESPKADTKEKCPKSEVKEECLKAATKEEPLQVQTVGEPHQVENSEKRPTATATFKAVENKEGLLGFEVEPSESLSSCRAEAQVEAGLPDSVVARESDKEELAEVREGCTMTSQVNIPVVMEENPLLPKASQTTDSNHTSAQSPSWSQIVEDEEKQKLASDKCVVGERQRNSSSQNRRHDSGVVSPNDSRMAKKDTGVHGGDSGPEDPTSPANQSVPSQADPPDGGLGTSVCEEETQNTDPVKPLHQSQNSQQQQQQATSRNTVKQHINGSDSGQGSEADDGGIRLAYHFYIPHYLCGQFIGMGGAKIKQLKTNTKCSVQLRQLDENGHFKTIQQQRESSRSGVAPREGEVQVCIIEGTRTNIDHCLELIRQKFPVDENPELTLEQINLPSSSSMSSMDGSQRNSIGRTGGSGGGKVGSGTANGSTTAATAQPLQLGLTQGALHDVFVSHIVSGGHIFLQQPSHPTHASLSRLEDLMCKAYTKLPSIPDIPREIIEPGLVCVARCYNSKWYRVQVVRFDAESSQVTVKFVDHGGYYNFPASDLKQIRSDYLALPFQALECYLGNVIPLDGREWSVESGEVLRQMVQGVIISGRMLGVNEEGVPIVHLYGWVNVVGQSDPGSGIVQDTSVSQHEQQPRLLNRELVDRSVALWTEHIIAN